MFVFETQNSVQNIMDSRLWLDLGPNILDSSINLWVKARNGSITTDSMYWPIKQCLKIRIEIQVIWQCLSLSFEETWEINIAKKEFSNTVLWVWMVLAWFCRKNEDLASSCLPQWPEIQNYVQKFWALFSSYCSEIWLDLPITHIVVNNGKQ